MTRLLRFIPRRGTRRGLSMIELLIGVVIFGTAMIPLLFLTQTSAKGSYSITRHMVGSQLCASIMDRLVALPFDAAIKKVKITKDKGAINVFDSSFSENMVMDSDFEAMVSAIPAPLKGHPMREELEKYLESYRYALETKPVDPDPAKVEEVMITVTVSWLDTNADPETQRKSIIRKVVKFKEDS